MRVVAGEFGGRRLTAPSGSDTRPTADRVREAMFSMLGDVAGLLVLDLFAGSGALAIEALSRGARRAVLVERSRPAHAAIARNLNALGLAERATVLPVAVERAAERLRTLGPFGLLLCDPPYADVTSGFAARLLGELVASGIAEAGALVVLEHASRDAPPELAGATCDRTRRYGDTSVTLYRVS